MILRESGETVSYYNLRLAECLSLTIEKIALVIMHQAITTVINGNSIKNIFLNQVFCLDALFQTSKYPRNPSNGLDNGDEIKPDNSGKIVLLVTPKADKYYNMVSCSELAGTQLSRNLIRAHSSSVSIATFCERLTSESCFYKQLFADFLQSMTAYVTNLGKLEVLMKIDTIFG